MRSLSSAAPTASSFSVSCAIVSGSDRRGALGDPAVRGRGLGDRRMLRSLGGFGECASQAADSFAAGAAAAPSACATPGSISRPPLLILVADCAGREIRGLGLVVGGSGALVLRVSANAGFRTESGVGGPGDPSKICSVEVGACKIDICFCGVVCAERERSTRMFSASSSTHVTDVPDSVRAGSIKASPSYVSRKLSIRVSMEISPCDFGSISLTSTEGRLAFSIP
mmetsp:Transcript_10504/g.27010  ORF Transcript_10504/g.27010 Transcript_10504/m.27010 type:complete len:226 (-) Transcript_10504:1060-1737(-)